MDAAVLAPMVRQCARKLHGRVRRHIELDDLLQEGFLGAMHAAAQYREGHGTTLQQFAYSRVAGAMVDYVRHETPAGRSRERVIVERLDDQLPDSERGTTVADTLPSPAPSPLDHVLQSDRMCPVRAVIATLPHQQRQVLALYYDDNDRTMREVGKLIGVCESRVCHIHNAAMRAIRKALIGKNASERSQCQ